MLRGQSRNLKGELKYCANVTVLQVQHNRGEQVVEGVKNFYSYNQIDETVPLQSF